MSEVVSARYPDGRRYGWLRCDGRNKTDRGQCGNTTVGGVGTPVRGGVPMKEIDGQHYCPLHAPREDTE